MVVDLPTFTLIHVVISVVGIVAGLVVVGGLMAGARLDLWTAMFLACTVFTSVSGFGFPSNVIAPAHVVGVLSLLLLALCLAARYWKQMNRRWRTTYVVTAVTALYLNVFVLVVQLFTKTPPLAQLAPTQSEAPFAITQALVFALFAWLGWAALRGFRVPRPGRA
jgi:hypothetical protein